MTEVYARRMPRLWSKKEDARLTELWCANKLPASYIAGAMNRTKNAIIGRAGRLGLPMRVPAAIIRSGKTKLPPREPPMGKDTSPVRPYADKARKPKSFPKYDLVPRRPRHPPTWTPPKAEPWIGKAVPFLEIGTQQCRAIVGSSDDRTHLPLFCGAPVPYGQPFSFCEHHLSIYTYKRVRS